LISIKVHQSLRKYRMEFYSIKVGQSFWSKISLTVVTIKVSSKTLTKKTLIVTTGLNAMLYMFCCHYSMCIIHVMRGRNISCSKLYPILLLNLSK
jgi:hypothetical protein